MSRSGSQISYILRSALLLLVMLVSAAAQERDFYRGKTISIIIPIGPGGAYDAYARLLSRHLGRHLPGNPTIIARNMPGGGGVIASNYLYNVAPQRWDHARDHHLVFCDRPAVRESADQIRRPRVPGGRAIARCDFGPVLLAFLADQDTA